MKVEILKNVHTSIGPVKLGQVRDDLPDADARTLLLIKAARLVGKGPAVETAVAKPKAETADARPLVGTSKRPPAKRKRGKAKAK